MTQTSEKFDAVIIGSGLAGASSAYALASRGLRVAIIDSANQIAEKASGNPWALLTPYVTTTQSPLETLYTSGYRFTHKILASLSTQDTQFNQCGSLQLTSTKRLAKLVHSSSPILGLPGARRISASEASYLAGVKISSEGAVFIPDAGFLAPRCFVQTLIGKFPQRVSVFLGFKAIDIIPDEGNHCVVCQNLALGETITFQGNSVVICSAYQGKDLNIASWLPLEAVRGQTISVASKATSADLKTVISFGGYMTPGVNQQHLLGAHYSHDDTEPAPRDSDTDTVLKLTNTWLPHLDLNSSQVTAARVCFRTSTLDRLPYIGALPNYAAFLSALAKYRSGTNLTNRVVVSDLSGIYINLGHGSRGLLSCPIGGEIIARLITNEPLWELADAAKATNPARLPWRLKD